MGVNKWNKYNGTHEHGGLAILLFVIFFPIGLLYIIVSTWKKYSNYRSELYSKRK